MTGPADRLPAEGQWFDDEAGPVVRLFAMTRGRTRPAEEGLFDLISMIISREPAGRAATAPEPVPEPSSEPSSEPASEPPSEPALDPEHRAILDLCREEPLSVAELGSYTDLPVSVVRVLLGDLYDAELIEVTRPVPLAELPDERVLRQVISGLRAL
ncbi:DUF742 domain-containing protein [Kitasatospora sp. NPDC052896]|uniref:DUF742 domain-containing protein n=1 Tax=Kitasatospora sp. NPDC052896 TaxID=3364061 RepID=UPI0037C97946